MLKIIFFLITSPQVFADEGSAYTFKEPIFIKANSSLEQASLNEMLEQSSRFNYYENQSLRSFSSVFVEGVDQRFLDLQFNGFSLRDPSSPTGVFNIAALSSLQGLHLNLQGGAALGLESRETRVNSVGASVSSLEEVRVDAIKHFCGSEDSCTQLQTSLERGGGYSQSDGGEEKDFFEEVTLSGSQSLKNGQSVFTTRLLYYGQVLDLDSLGPLETATSESKTAKALNSVLFIGQDFDFSARHRLMLSYTSSYRNQTEPEQDLSYRQRGEVFESAYIFNNKLKFKFFHERFNLYSAKGADSGLSLQRTFKLGGVNLDFSLGKSRLRSLSWSSEVGYKNFVLFYKGLPPSLFQQSYNDEFGDSPGSLESQQFVGIRYSKEHKLSLLTVKWNISYSRIYEFVDFNLAENSYDNLGEVENFFVGLNLLKGPLSFLIQNQISRQVREVRRDLPRRAPWTLGLGYEKKINRYWNMAARVKWLSERKAFDQSNLEAAWMTDLGLSYKNLSLTCTNVFFDREAVFKNLGRRPFSARLNYQKNF